MPCVVLLSVSSTRIFDDPDDTAEWNSENTMDDFGTTRTQSGQKTHPIVRRWEKETFKRLSAMHFARTDVHVDVGNFSATVLTGRRQASTARFPTLTVSHFRAFAARQRNRFGTLFRRYHSSWTQFRPKIGSQLTTQPCNSSAKVFVRVF